MDVPETFQARINRLNIQGISAFKDGRNKVAETLFANVLLLDKQNQEARFNLGYLHYTQSNYSLATTFFAPLYNETYTPDSANLPLLYGYSLCKTGMPNRGVIIIQKGMKEMSDTQRIAAVNTVEKCLKINHRR